jgi:3'(2'), 5'-bisphosphate nucleotidase
MDSASQKYLMTALRAALAAGEAILEVYGKPDLKTELKEDASPVTEADHAAHARIMDHLLPLNLPVLSEEGKETAAEERRKWRIFWLVDPLDGTKEFIRKNGEFTVNIALIHGTRPIMGVLYAPIPDLMYFSDNGAGAFRLEGFSKNWKRIKTADELIEASEPLPLKRPEGGEGFRVVASRSHISHDTSRYIQSLRTRYPDLEMVSRGSALKFCLVAEGTADVYPRFGPTWEWDTGAGQAIAEASGCQVTLLDERTRLEYNKEELLNPGFIVRR